MNELTIGLGHCGSTDCCLTLSDGIKIKEFLIETESWKICNNLSLSLPTKFTSDDFDDSGYKSLLKLFNSDTLEDERTAVRHKNLVPSVNEFQEAKDKNKKYLALCMSGFGMVGEEWCLEFNEFAEIDISPNDVISFWNVDTQRKLFR